MIRQSAVAVCLVVATSFSATLAQDVNVLGKREGHVLAPFEFQLRAAVSPEAAARSMFQGVSRESPKHFVQHLLLGVCDGSVDTLQKFAESMHKTEFSHGTDSFTFYDLRELRRGINRKKPVRIIATAPFDTEDEQVKALKHEMMSTYYGETFVAVDAVAEGYDHLDYRTRIVVTKVAGGWYAIPRCRSAQRFYNVADGMRLAPDGSEVAR